MPWDAIIGQRRVVSAVRMAIETGRIPHAWLFTGPEGVGKDAVAMMVAQALRCERRVEGGSNPCGECHGCITTAALQNANVRFIFALPSGKGEDARGDAPMLRLSDAEISLIQGQVSQKASDPYFNIQIPRAQQIKISSIREVRRDISFTAVEPGWRVVIVSEAHLMGEEAANAFLKTLEEPSARTLIILTSSHRERLLPTIRSRCQEVRFDNLTESDIAAALVERRGADRTSAALLAKLADGSYARAVELHAGELTPLRQDVVSFLRGALRRSPLALHAEVERLSSGNDRVAVERMLMLLALWLRDVATLHLTGSDAHVVNRDQIKDIESFAGRFGATALELIDEVETTIRNVRSNAQLPLALTVLGLRIEERGMQSQSRRGATA